MEKYLGEGLSTAFSELKLVLKDDKSYLKMKPIEEMQRTIELLGSLYVRYLKVVNNLSQFHNYLLNPLKRQCLKDLIELMFGRIMEIKHEMVDVEKSDFQYLDDIILHNHITRKNVQLQLPDYIKDQREETVTKINHQINIILYMKEHPEEFVIAEEKDEEVDRNLQGLIIETKASVNRITRVSTQSVDRKSSVSRETHMKKVESKRPELARESKLKAAAMEEKFKKRPQAAAKAEAFEFMDELKLIQRHERARTARKIALQTLQHVLKKRNRSLLAGKEVPEDEADKAAVTIQHHYMAYKNKKWKKYLDNYKGLTYGTLMSSYRDKTDINEVEKLIETRKKHQKELEIIMANKKKELMEKMQLMKKYEIMEDMIIELRYFIRRWYDFTKEYGYTEVPEWPTDDEIIPPARVLGIPEGLPKSYITENFPEMDYTKVGPAPTITLTGSEVITAGFWIPVAKYVTAAELARATLLKGLPVDDTEKDAIEKEAEKEREEAKKEEERRELEELMKKGHVPTKSNISKDLTARVGEFLQGWEIGAQCSSAHDEECLEEQLKTETTYQIIRQVRKDVDNQMRKELKILNSAIVKDNFDRPKIPKLKKKNTKGKKKKTKKRKKGKKDPLANRTIESLFDELAYENLIIKCNEINIDFLPGLYNLHAQEGRAKLESPIPGMADIYQVTKEYVVLPLTSAVVKKNSPAIKSIMFIGPNRLTHPLVHSLGYSVGALMIYLPALNFTKKFKNKILINMILKVAKEYEPSILFIDGAEKPFYKKVPKNEKPMRPKALKAIIPKLIKGIKPADRIIVLATAEKPWLSRPKLASIFQKILICSENDYHCMSALVQNTIMRHHGVDREFDTSVPSAIFMGWPLTEVEERLESIFTTERKLRLFYDPLKIDETGCIEKDISKINSLEDWYNKLYPLNKARVKMLEVEKEKKEKLEKQKEAEKRTLIN